jgi:tetratricopeptide (TPR) repeat protein
LAVTIRDLPNLLKEVAAGHPVIVFENLALSWFPRWHYAVIFGYDLDHETVTLHSGPEAFKHWDMSRFERSWRLGDYWGLVVLPPGQLAATASEQDNARAAAALEEIGQTDAAKISYESILKRWPDSLVSMIGLGNIEYQRKNFVRAVAYLQAAVKAHPESQAAQNNLQVALQALKEARKNH